MFSTFHILENFLFMFMLFMIKCLNFSLKCTRLMHLIKQNYLPGKPTIPEGPGSTHHSLTNPVGNTDSGDGAASEKSLMR